MKSFALAVLALALALGVSASVRADDAATSHAAAEYDAGARAFENQQFAEAARAFERADAIAPHPRTRYNAALSWDRAGDAPRAADAYAASLEGTGLDRERQEAAKSRLAELTKKIGALDVRRPNGGKVSVAHVQGASIPARIHVAPGTHRVELVARDGTREQREVEVHAGERVVLEIAITSAPLAQPTPPARTAAASVTPSPPQGEAEPTSARTTWGLITLGGAAAFGAGAVVFGVRTADAIDDFDASGDRDAEARDRAVRYRALTWASGGASLICATIGVILLAAGDSGQAARSPRLEVSVRGSGVAAEWRF